MKESCFSTSKKTKFSTLTPSDFVLLLLSPHLYLSSFIFFSPYLFKLLSFLSPLFITTTLLLLSLLSTHFTNTPKGTSFFTLYHTILDKLLASKFNDESDLLCFEELQVYEIVFGSSPICEVVISEVETCKDVAVDSEHPVENEKDPVENEKDPVENEHSPDEITKKFVEEKRLEFQKAIDMWEKLSGNGAKGKEDETNSTRPNKVEDKASSLASAGREDNYNKPIQPPPATAPNKGANFQQTHDGQSLRTSSSMRKEREWRRTLACKLFEERHNANSTTSTAQCGNDEGMDLLWEAHEAAANRGQRKSRKKGKFERDEDDEFEEEEGEDGKICCLQALKLSTGKVNLGMGRPNLIRISKAFKGIGWLQSHVSRQGKKGYHKNP